MGKDVEITPERKNYLRIVRKTGRDKNEMAFLILCRSQELEPPNREFRFHETRRWRLDFAWPSARLGIEIEGGIWRKGGGAHSHPSNIMRDIEKHNALMLAGWRFLRLTDKDIKDGSAILLVKEVLNKIKNNVFT